MAIENKEVDTKSQQLRSVPRPLMISCGSPFWGLGVVDFEFQIQSSKNLTLQNNKKQWVCRDTVGGFSSPSFAVCPPLSCSRSGGHRFGGLGVVDLHQLRIWLCSKNQWVYRDTVDGFLNIHFNNATFYWIRRYDLERRERSASAWRPQKTQVSGLKHQIQWEINC